VLKIKVNDKTIETEITNLKKFLESKKINLETIVVDINGKILKPEEYSGYTLKKNDKINIFNFVGGG